MRSLFLQLNQTDSKKERNKYSNPFEWHAHGPAQDQSASEWLRKSGDIMCVCVYIVYLRALSRWTLNKVNIVCNSAWRKIKQQQECLWQQQQQSNQNTQCFSRLGTPAQDNSVALCVFSSKSLRNPNREKCCENVPENSHLPHFSLVYASMLRIRYGLCVCVFKRIECFIRAPNELVWTSQTLK